MVGSCSCVPINGTVYGVALDVDDPFGAPSDLFTMPPYHRAPKTPVLFIKPRNTFLAHGGSALLPSGLQELEVSAALAVAGMASYRSDLRLLPGTNCRAWTIWSSASKLTVRRWPRSA
jgi:hypothetical protein